MSAVIVPALHDRARAVAQDEAGPEVQGKVTEEVAVGHIARVAVTRARVAVDPHVEAAAVPLVTAHVDLPMTARMLHAMTARMLHAMTAHTHRLTTAHVVRRTRARVTHLGRVRVAVARLRRVAVGRLVEVRAEDTRRKEVAAARVGIQPGRTRGRGRGAAVQWRPIGMIVRMMIEGAGNCLMEVVLCLRLSDKSIELVVSVSQFLGSCCLRILWDNPIRWTCTFMLGVKWISLTVIECLTISFSGKSLVTMYRLLKVLIA